MDDSDAVLCAKLFKLGLNVAMWILLFNQKPGMAFAVFIVKYFVFNLPAMIAGLLETWYGVDLNEEIGEIQGEDTHEHQD